MADTTATHTPPQVEAGPAITYGWQSVKKDFWYFVGVAAIALVLSSVGDADRTPSRWSLIGFFLSILMTCGYTTLVLSYQQGRKLPISTLFTSVSQYWRVMGATILIAVIVGLGFALLILPGLYFALTFQLTINLIIDKQLGIFEAMRQSARLTKGRKMSLLGFDLVCLGVIILGALALGVGLLVAMPVVWLAGVTVYRKLASSAESIPA